MKTYGYGGSTLSKKIRVDTGGNPGKQLTMTIKGPVERVVDISPRVLRVQGKSGEVISSKATITPDRKYPFKVLKSRLAKGSGLKLDLQKDLSTGLPRYVATVKSLASASGNFYDTIVLETDSKFRPEIKITVSAAFKN